MKKDAIILAGTQKYPQLKVDVSGRVIEDHKQFLPLGGKRVIEHVIDAALDCPEIGDIYIPTDRQKLTGILAGRPGGVPERVNVVEDHPRIVDNVLFTFFRHVLPAHGYDPIEFNMDLRDYVGANRGSEDIDMVILTSDIPFIKSEDISRHLAMSDPDADFGLGFTDERSMEYLEQYVGKGLMNTETKTAFFPFEDTRIRWSNISTGKPLRIPPEIADVIQETYAHRYLLGDDGGENAGNWAGITKAFLSYARRHSSTGTVMYGALTGFLQFVGLLVAYKTGPALPNLFCDRYGVEKTVHNLAGRKLLGRMNITDVAHTALDIDNAGMYEMLKADGEELFWRIRESPRQYLPLVRGPVDLSDELSCLVETAPELFGGAPELLRDMSHIRRR